MIYDDVDGNNKQLSKDPDEDKYTTHVVEWDAPLSYTHWQ